MTALWVSPIWVQADGNNPIGRNSPGDVLQYWRTYFLRFFPESSGLAITPDTHPSDNLNLYVFAKGSSPHVGLMIMIDPDRTKREDRTKMRFSQLISGHGPGPATDLIALTEEMKRTGVVGDRALETYLTSQHKPGETVAAYITSLLLKIAHGDEAQKPGDAAQQKQAADPEQPAEAPPSGKTKKKGDPDFTNESGAIPLNTDDASEYGGQHMVSHEIGVSILPFVAALELAPKAGRKGFTDTQKKKLMQAFGFNTLDWGEAVQRALDLGYMPGGAK